MDNRDAANAWDRQNYQKIKHTPAYKKRRDASAAARAKRGYDIISPFKDKPCMDCGGTFPLVCMDFDHRDPSTKLFNVAQGIRKSKEAILAEIAKCDLVCANCHRIRSWPNHI